MRTERVAVLLLGVLGLSRGARSAATEPAPPTEPGPASGCQSCHADQVAHWRRSRHAVSATNSAFVAAMRTADLPSWCLSCHDPSGADRSITCATCHGSDGEVITSRAPHPDAEAAHPMRVEPELGQPAFCGRCHEFDAPDVHGTLDVGGPLQSTLSEWRTSGSEQGCVECHLDGHRFTGRQLMRDAVRVDVVDERLVVSLVGEVGHAVPTGDPFRRLQLRACADEACEELLGTQTFSRLHRFDGETWWPDGDHRLGPEGTGLPSSRSWAPPPGTRHWELVYELTNPRDAPWVEPEEQLIPLASGRWPE